MEATITGEKPNFKTKVTRNASGGYGFEITTYGLSSMEEAEALNGEAVKSVENLIAQAQATIPVIGK